MSCDIKMMSLCDDPLNALARKGNLSYITELFNPENYFETVHHIAFRPEDKYIDIGNDKIRVHVLKSLRKSLPFIWVVLDFPLCLIQILHIASKYRVSLIRGRGPQFASFFGLLAGKILKIPFTVSIGGNHRFSKVLSGSYPVFRSRFIYNLIEEFILRNADLVIVPNAFSEKYALSLGVAMEKIRVIPWCLKKDVYNFTFQKSDVLLKAGVDLTKPIILFVGRFEGDKQVDVLIEAIPFVLKDFPSAQFVFIGDGSLLPKCKNRARELDVEKSVYFLGFQSIDSIKYCMHKSVLVWIPMSGWVILEAAAASKAIITFCVEWHSEFIRNGETGFIVEDRNHRKMAEAVCKILSDPGAAETLGKNARRLLEENYDPKKLASKEISALLGLIGKGIDHEFK